jgi:hypothetical protein
VNWRGGKIIRITITNCQPLKMRCLNACCLDWPLFLSYNQVSFCLNIWCFSLVLNRL